MSKKLLVIGAGGHALEVLELVQDIYEELLFFDNQGKENNNKVIGVPARTI